MFAADRDICNPIPSVSTTSIQPDLSTEIGLIQAWQYIRKMDLSRIMDRFVDYHCWLRSDVEDIARHYRHFLYLKKKYGHQHKLPPSVELDEFWHAHILDTEKYREDCCNIFGHYLDHYPYFGVDGKSDFDDLRRGFDILQELLQKEFGEQLRCYRGSVKRLSSTLKKMTKKLHPVYMKNNL
ncbi:MAG: hypothetical protein K0R12_1199 [Gammaproteobacteria bacterium]|jgi:hypothetical protein|nr:hypothetical protein [Gammaproteobacteria bacterium]